MEPTPALDLGFSLLYNTEYKGAASFMLLGLTPDDFMDTVVQFSWYQYRNGLLQFCLRHLISHFKINLTALDIIHVKPFEETLCEALVYYYLLFCLENMD